MPEFVRLWSVCLQFVQCLQSPVFVRIVSVVLSPEFFRRSLSIAHSLSGVCPFSGVWSVPSPEFIPESGVCLLFGYQSLLSGVRSPEFVRSVEFVRSPKFLRSLSRVCPKFVWSLSVVRNLFGVRSLFVVWSPEVVWSPKNVWRLSALCSSSRVSSLFRSPDFVCCLERLLSGVRSFSEDRPMSGVCPEFGLCCPELGVRTNVVVCSSIRLLATIS
jgi:hypothetical protein